MGAMRIHFAAVAAGAAIALGSTFPIAPSVADSNNQPATLKLVQREADNMSTIVDNPPKNVEGPGDMFIVGGTVRTPALKKAGEVSAVFVQTSPTLAHGSVTFDLTRGKIVVQGTIDHGDDNTLSIVGGTGAYVGAKGTMRLKGAESGTEFTFTFAP